MLNYILFPGIVFIVSLIIVLLFSRYTEDIMATNTSSAKDKKESETVYACGEEYEGKKAEPDYNKFFPFAVFFTIMHVAALMIATLASASVKSAMAISIFYLVTVSVILAILYKD